MAGAVVGAAAPLPVPLGAAPELLVGDAAGVEVGGNETKGVGSGGNGFVMMPAINWSSPSVLSLFRNLYHCCRLSFQPVFGVAKSGLVPATLTARA